MRRTVGALLLAGALGLGFVSPASAETVVIHDGRDTDAAQELVAVRITHDRKISVTFKYSTNYFRDGEYPFTIYYDTKPLNRGPEFALYSHFSEVYKINGWRGGLQHEVQHCNPQGHVNLTRHLLTVTITHRCLRGDTGPVRVSVVTTAKYDDGPTVLDYAPGYHQFSAPVARS